MAVFYSSLTSWFPGMLLTYFIYDFEMVPAAHIITGITFVFTLLLLLLLLLCNHDVTNIRGSKYIYYSTSLSCYGPVSHLQEYHSGANNGTPENGTEGRNF
jgi:hypothetical protein